MRHYLPGPPILVHQFVVVTKQIDDADTCENGARFQKTKYCTAEAARKPVVVFVVSGVIDGARGKTNSAAD